MCIRKIDFKLRGYQTAGIVHNSALQGTARRLRSDADIAVFCFYLQKGRGVLQNESLFKI
jgi:hypothetical protein